jgi:hypothetical protein
LNSESPLGSHSSSQQHRCHLAPLISHCTHIFHTTACALLTAVVRPTCQLPPPMLRTAHTSLPARPPPTVTEAPPPLAGIWTKASPPHHSSVSTPTCPILLGIDPSLISLSIIQSCRNSPEHRHHRTMLIITRTPLPEATSATSSSTALASEPIPSKPCLTQPPRLPSSLGADHPAV